MTELQRVTRVQELAEEIRALAKLTAEGIVEIGHRLIEARAILKAEGRWVAWLEDEFDWSVSTAYQFIRVAEAVRREPRLVKFRSPSVLYLMSGAPDEALEALLDFEGGYAEAKLAVDAHRWAEKARAIIAALGAVDLEEACRRGNSRVVNLARLTAARLLAEMEAAAEGEARRLAVELYREHGEWLADVTGTDPVENMRNAGLTLRERHGEPATGKIRAKFYDDRERARLVVWCGNGPQTVAEFPRTGSSEADAWRVACIEACLEATGCKN